MESSGQLQTPIFDEPISSIETDATQWSIKRQCSCCGPYVEVFVPSKKPRKFLRHWECQPVMPIAVTILTMFCLVDYFVVAYPYSYKVCQIIAPFPIIITCVLFMWSYFNAVCMDPGFLPFNWVQTKKFYYTWQEQLSGLAVTQTQATFAKDPKNRPPHCSFSTSFGRYVIRADHICGWISNWVGKRNHKQFMLLNLYGGLYTGSLLGFNFGTKTFLFNREMSYMMAQLVAMALELSFCVVLIGFFITTLIDLAHNRTKIQKMRGDKGNNKYTFRESMEEVCGTGSKCLWCCPTPAFDENMIITEDMPSIDDNSD